MHELIEWLVAVIGAMGYPGIFLLMAMESSVFPVPSELVMPPAGYLAQQGEMNIWLAIVCGTLGSLAGAYANYFAAHYLGRPLLLRYGRYVWITEEKFSKVERYFRSHGEISTFIGRLLPVVRHLIGIPAGIVRMNYRAFSIYTLLGSGIWCAVLCYIGIKMGQDERLMKGELHRVSLWLGGVMLALGGMYYFFVHRHMQARSEGRSHSHGTKSEV